MLVLEVLIERAARSLNRPFTYLYSGTKKVDVGFRVLVSFNKIKCVAYVLKATVYKKTKEEIIKEFNYELLEIEDIIDMQSILNEELISLSDQISSFYLAPKISVLQAMLPPSLKPRLSSLKGPKIAYDQYAVINNYNEEGLSDKQIELMRLIKEEKRVLKREIKQTSILKKLIELDLIKIENVEKVRLKLPKYSIETPKELTKDQEKVIEEFEKSTDSTYLLEGVTGSGKTEVYLSISEKILRKGKSVLMLVPEISLTPSMVEYFLRRFKGKVAVLHSALTPSEKYDEYRRISRGECQVVVGARSAIFAPLNNIGLIILDEEHVESYKQDNLPYYHAREVALMRAKYHSAKVILGSATPSLESMARAQKGVYHHLYLPHRINKQELPATSIINLLDGNNLSRDSSMFSIKLIEAIKETLSKNEQVILLINRRGYAPYINCRKCGHVIKCPNCEIALTYHKNDNMLKCHHCGFVMKMPDYCPDCDSPYLMKAGFGTERIEEEVKRLFKNVRTLRLDSDSSKVREKIPQTLEKFRKHEADVLIGTQMIAKGHDFPNVTLVGVVLADIGLALPNYRSAERTFQLITQAVGRSGRANKKGKAIIQSYMPSHYAVIYGAKQDYRRFYIREMHERKIQQYPPYTYLISITMLSKNEEMLIDTIFELNEILNERLGDKATILGPIAPYIAKEGPFFKRAILIKHKDSSFVKEIVLNATKYLNLKSSISLRIDIDPYDF